MAITDALRKEVFYAPMEPDQRGRFNAIANRIDAAHAEAQRRWMAELDAARDRDGYIKLPKDAGGEVIRIGDKVTCGASVWEVTGFRLAGGGWGICCTIFFDQGGSGTNVYPPSELHHYHASTVEDVLEELLHEYDRDDSELTNGEIIERFAAKLRLAGEVDG